MLQNRGNTLSLEITKSSAQSAPAQGKELVFKDASRFLFGGFVNKATPIEIGKGQLFVYKIEVTDYTYIPINKSAQISYSNQTLKYIVEDLVSNYIDSGYGITTTEVDVGPTIPTIG